jgi:Ca2+-binding RTX toxin-like protein
MTSGVGNDICVVDNAGDTVVEAASGGIDTVISQIISYTLSPEAENLTLVGGSALSSPPAITVSGTDNYKANRINGIRAQRDFSISISFGTFSAPLYDGNILSGLGGNDILNGGFSAYAMSGGVGNDTHFVDNVGDIETEVAGGGIDTVVNSMSFILGANIENLTLDGGAGNDQLIGGRGIDILHGGAENDDLYIHTGNIVTSDVVAGEIYDGGIGNDALVGAYNGCADFSNVTLNGIEDLSGSGSSELILTAAQLAGFTGSINANVITLSTGGSIDLFSAEVRTTQFNFSNAGNTLILPGISSVYVSSGAYNITFNSLTNAGGKDLRGNGGNDRLTGGLGTDWFVYHAVGNGTDIITGFSGRTAFGGGAGEGDRFMFFFVAREVFQYRGAGAFRER